MPIHRAKAGLVIKLPSSLGLNTNLVGYWTFDGADIWEGNTRAADKSGNNLHGTFTNNPSPGSGRIGQALEFNRQGGGYAKVSVGDNSALTPPDDMSITFWFYLHKKPSVQGENTFFIYKSHSTTPPACTCSYQMLIQGSGGSADQLYAEWSNSSGSAMATASASDLEANTWYHAAMVKRGTSPLELYINAVINQTYSDANPGGTLFDSDGELRIYNTGATNGNGRLDDVRVYSRALSAAEIRRLYNMGGTLKVGTTDTKSLNTNLVGHWTFDGADIWEGSTRAADKSGQNNHGTITNGPTASTGKLGQALNFVAAQSQCVIIGDPADDDLDFGTNSFSYGLWVFVKNTNGSFDTPWVKGGGTATANGYDMELGSGAWLPNLADGDEIHNSTSFSGSPILNRWVHLFVVVDRSGAGTVSAYVDGALVDSDALSGTFGSVSGIKSAVISSDGTGGCTVTPFNGSIDDVRVYSRALSAAEIRRLYNMGGTLKVGTTDTKSLNTNLVGHWTMDATDISWTDGNIQDRSTSGNKGAFQGAMATTSAPVAGRIGQALKFDGTNDLIQITAASSINNLGPMTVSAWIKPKSAGGGNFGRVIGKDAALGSTKDWAFHITGAGVSSGLCGATVTNAMVFGKRNNELTGLFATKCSADNTVTMGVWQHILVTWDGTTGNSGIHIYSNGVEVLYNTDAATSGTSGDDSSLNLLIGNRPAADRSFDGSIDDVRIYSRVLSAAEIQRLYQMGR